MECSRSGMGKGKSDGERFARIDWGDRLGFPG